MEKKESGMRVWLYSRLSRDDDKDQNSLINQHQIIASYAHREGHTIVGSSHDDNLSGMHFDERDGIDQLMAAAKAGKIDAVIVKDLSRFGRHKILTPLFREQLRVCGVRVLSATENIDTFDESNELLLGFKDLLNDSYARDISRKIRAGFQQKQKEGLVILPPFGYTKDANKQIIIVEECAQIVRLVFQLYLGGFGVRKITQYLTENNYKTPSYYQYVHNKKKIPYNSTKMGKEHVWSDRSITEMLRNEAYIGVLYCGKSSKNTIHKTRKAIPQSEWIRHDDFYPPIISNEVFTLVQEERRMRDKISARASSNKKIYRYAGLLKCRECDSCFTSKMRKQQDYVEYVCNSYHRLGTKYCSSHRIREGMLDEIIYEQVAEFRYLAAKHWDRIDGILHQSSKEGKQASSTLSSIDKEIAKLEYELKNALDMMIQFPDRYDTFEELAADRETRIKKLKEQKGSLAHHASLKKNASVVYQRGIEIFDKAIKDRSIDDSHLRLIIDSIIVGENSDGTLSIDVSLNAPFLNIVKDIQSIDDVLTVSQGSFEAKQANSGI
ncbi:recombinase family protein [Eubacteriales bacterium OttesenSCG-928-K08]|nr:recombinase family protein [Eubacteriales bacterium OttesenSCG-928-K08]